MKKKMTPKVAKKQLKIWLEINRAFGARPGYAARKRQYTLLLEAPEPPPYEEEEEEEEENG